MISNAFVIFICVPPVQKKHFIHDYWLCSMDCLMGYMCEVWIV